MLSSESSFGEVHLVRRLFGWCSGLKCLILKRWNLSVEDEIRPKVKGAEFTMASSIPSYFDSVS